MSKSHCN